jgi:hypothetical protein
MLDIVRLAQRSSKPADPDMKVVAAPLAESLQQSQAKATGPRCESVNHDKAMYECLQGLTWVTYDTAALGASLC